MVLSLKMVELLLTYRHLMTVIDLLSGLFNDVLQGRQRRSSFAGFRLRTLAENPAKLIAGVAYPAKNVIY